MNRLGRNRAGEYDKKYPLEGKLEALSVPIPFSGCKVWLGALNDAGYGRVKVNSRFRRAHIVAWEIERGKVPSGLVLDHLCCTKSCINPAHLEAVTSGEN